MSNVTTLNNPLMQPIQYNGQTYFTGQYFHQMYRNNSDTDGKYKRTGDFIRLIRSIETYQNYVKVGDIVELTKDKANPESGPASEADAKIALAFKATFGKPIMLINATAQVALTHHLDDEVSKNASVNVNRNAANSDQRVLARDIKAAKEAIGLICEFGKMVGTEPQMINVLAADQVTKMTGIDVTPLLANNHVEENPMTPSELGKQLGISGRKMNIELESHGFQAKNDDGDWVPTEKGEQYCTVNPYKAPKSDHTGYRILWYKKVLEVLTKAA